MTLIPFFTCGMCEIGVRMFPKDPSALLLIQVMRGKRLFWFRLPGYSKFKEAIFKYLSGAFSAEGLSFQLILFGFKFDGTNFDMRIFRTIQQIQDFRDCSISQV